MREGRERFVAAITETWVALRGETIARLALAGAGVLWVPMRLSFIGVIRLERFYRLVMGWYRRLVAVAIRQG